MTHIYTTMYKPINCKINYIGCLMEVERLNTLINHKIATNEDIQSSIEVINNYLNHYFNVDDYNLNNIEQFINELNELIGGIL